MNDSSFVQAIKHELCKWLLASEDTTTVLWAITDLVRQYEEKVGYRSEIKITDTHPDVSEL